MLISEYVSATALPHALSEHAVIGTSAPQPYTAYGFGAGWDGSGSVQECGRRPGARLASRGSRSSCKIRLWLSALVTKTVLLAGTGVSVSSLESSGVVRSQDVPIGREHGDTPQVTVFSRRVCKIADDSLPRFASWTCHQEPHPWGSLLSRGRGDLARWPGAATGVVTAGWLSSSLPVCAAARAGSSWSARSPRRAGGDERAGCRQAAADHRERGRASRRGWAKWGGRWLGSPVLVVAGVVSHAPIRHSPGWRVP
jgi:hypothetical protein